MKAPMLVYVAAPYRAATQWDTEQNIRRAEALGYEVAKLGAYPVIPHCNTRPLFESAQSDPAFWLDGTMALMLRCDAVLFAPDWERSSGARAERERAWECMPVYDRLENLALAIDLHQRGKL